MTEDDFDRTARRWLEEGPTVLSDRAFQAALDEIHLTPQRRAWWPARRARTLNTPMRLGIAVAAVLVVAVTAYSLLPTGSGVGGGPTLEPTSSPGPTATPVAFPEHPQEHVVTEPGRYAIDDPFPVPITISVPVGWLGKVGGPYAAYLDSPGATIAFSRSQTFYADPCTGGGFLDQQPGPSVEDLATLLAGMPGLEATAAAEITVDGFRGEGLELALPDPFDECPLPPDGYPLWQLPLGSVVSMEPGHRVALWILDIDGDRVVVSSHTSAATTAEELAQVEDILASIRIQPTN